ncbi:MAG: hypothetical protein JWO53_1124, partial [Chlamydiia bacterium]|nr:hypothetical protein [Chlamydiia bacterium]
MYYNYNLFLLLYEEKEMSSESHLFRPITTGTLNAVSEPIVIRPLVRRALFSNTSRPQSCPLNNPIATTTKQIFVSTITEQAEPTTPLNEKQKYSPLSSP